MKYFLIFLKTKRSLFDLLFRPLWATKLTTILPKKYTLRKVLKILISIFILSILLVVVYCNLPLEVKRKSEIELGNSLIKNIYTYQIKYNKLPDNNDSQTLKKLGFTMDMLGTKPSYETNLKGEFEIVFLEGFDGPYLLWNSKLKKWKMSYPTIFNQYSENEDENEFMENREKISGKSIIFLRPREKKFESFKEEDGIFEIDSDFGFAISNTIDFLNTNPKFNSFNIEIISKRYIEITDCIDCPKMIDCDSILYGIILNNPNKEIKIINSIQALNYNDEIENYFK